MFVLNENEKYANVQHVGTAGLTEQWTELNVIMKLNSKETNNTAHSGQDK